METNITQINALQLAKEFANQIQTIIPNFKMRLYSSFARGEAIPDSD